MFRGENKECCAEQSVGTCGEHFNATSGGLECDASTFTAIDPVALHHLDGLWPIQTIEVFDEAIRIRSDAHHPLLHVALEHRIVADVATAFRSHFFVCEDGSQTWTPVHRCISEICQAIRIDENMLL